jgi:hypothetical protein
VQSYEIHRSQAVSFSARVNHIFSTPNLRADVSHEKDHGLRRSQSATSMGLPRVSPLSPLRLPSLSSHDKDGRSWAEILEESIRLPRLPVPPRSLDLRTSETVLHVEQNLPSNCHPNQTSESDTAFLSQPPEQNVPKGSRHDLKIDGQLPISAVSDQLPKAIKDTTHENTQPVKDPTGAQESGVDNKDEDEDQRRSVHLHSMRISHHLRSGSLLSWNQFADPSELSSPSSRPCRPRATSDQSQAFHINTQLSRCERQTSTSGFINTRTPSKLGKFIYQEFNSPGDLASSVYSSRPHSPPDSFGGSMANLSPNTIGHDASKSSLTYLPEHRRSSSFPTDDEETPRPLYRHGRAVTAATPDPFTTGEPITPEITLARKSSTADTKKSKFREEFGAVSPQKRMIPATSLWRLLTPKRLSMHSQSEGSLSSAPSIRTGDGGFDALQVPVDRQRRQSRSLMSLSTEHQALRRNKEIDQVKGSNNVWNKALEAHQKEKALLFLPENKELAVRASPFRARSGSIFPFPRNEAEAPIEGDLRIRSRRASTAMLDLHVSNRSELSLRPALVTRRSAISGQEAKSSDQGLSTVFDKQGDGVDVVGAWGRYPSHTRTERGASAGKSDLVESRDFALEAAVHVTSAQAVDGDDQELDPTERVPSLPLLPGQKRRKKKVGSGRMVKSTSMTFGRTFLKHYSRIFRSQSTDFRRHGKNHRSSITTGGVLEFPELELLPEVWADRAFQESETGEQSGERSFQQHETKANGISRLETEDSSSTLRPRRHSDIPDLSTQVFHDGTADIDPVQDRARAWSAFYGTCMPATSRLNSEANLSLGKPNAFSGSSIQSRPSSPQSRTMPDSLMKHSRNVSNMSGTSATSQRSVWPRLISSVEENVAMEERSIFGVRRSTMDLMLKFKEQEITEHDRVLSFTRAHSRRNTGDTKTL